MNKKRNALQNAGRFFISFFRIFVNHFDSFKGKALVNVVKKFLFGKKPCETAGGNNLCVFADNSFKVFDHHVDGAEIAVIGAALH